MFLRRLLAKNNLIRSKFFNLCVSGHADYSKKANSFETSAETTKNNDPQSNKDDNNNPLGSSGLKYKKFKDEDSEIVLDVYEERLKYHNDLLDKEQIPKDVFEGINKDRGLRGVFDIEDLVEVLERENAEDLFVAKVPEDIQYVDFIVVVSGKSKRHMKAIVEFVRRVYKQKRHKNDSIPVIEGENSTEWMAIDLGNIALHVFSREARTYYDLDSLWSVGPEYDKEFNKKDEVVEMLEKHTLYLHDLEPAPAS